MSDWKVVLDGVVLSGCDLEGAAGLLSYPPEGLGLPGLRTEDVTFPQADGVRHFADWYEPRIITLTDVTVCPEGCPGCPTARQLVRDIVCAWDRKCDDVELVVHVPCEDPNDTNLTGPFGIVGRPRVAEVVHARGSSGCSTLLLRFDATDQRMFILDPTGEPGSGGGEVTLTPDTASRCRTYPRCYPLCYNNDTGDTGGGPVTVNVLGTECAAPTICFHGRLTNPVLENVTTGDTIGYGGTIQTGAMVCIDTARGTATEGTASRTHLITGDPRFTLQPGFNELRLSSFASSDDGFVTVTWRPSVVTI